MSKFNKKIIASIILGTLTAKGAVVLDPSLSFPVIFLLSVILMLQIMFYPSGKKAVGG